MKQEIFTSKKQKISTLTYVMLAIQVVILVVGFAAKYYFLNDRVVIICHALLLGSFAYTANRIESLSKSKVEVPMWVNILCGVILGAVIIWFVLFIIDYLM